MGVISKRKHMIRSKISGFIALVLTVLLLANSTIALAAEKKAKLEYNINLSTSSVHTAIQNFYIGSTYLYITQRVGSTTYLSRCTLSGTTFVYESMMTLNNFGHGETLEYMDHNGESYFLVGAKSDGSDEAWSVQMAVIKYTKGKVMDYTAADRFTYMNYSTKDGTSMGSAERIAGAVSQNNDRIIFRFVVNGTIRYSIYKRNALLNLLFSQTGTVKTLDMRQATSAWSSSFQSTVKPNGSFQGLEMSGIDKFYVSGIQAPSAQHDLSTRQKPIISRMNINGAAVSSFDIVDPNGVDFTIKYTKNNVEKTLGAEIEGLQVKDNKIYLVVITDAYNKATSQKIYSVPEF